jgi:multimeric flavodoxin WrbA
MDTITPTVLALIASPRVLGNCETFTKEVSRNIPEGHRLKLIRLTSLKIGRCRACYGCVVGNRCPIEDDMVFLLDEIARADAFIIASPVYYLGANASIKAILDRGFLFFDILGKTHGKPAILLNFYGMPGRIGVAPQMLETLAAFLGLSVKASLSIKAALPGEALMNKANTALAARLGKALFSPGKRKRTGGCPFCGCEIIRVVPKGFVCTVCHGSFTTGPKGRFVKAKEGGILGPPEHMLLHREWLRGMKERFNEKKREIMKTIIPYRDEGEWVEPPGK